MAVGTMRSRALLTSQARQHAQSIESPAPYAAGRRLRWMLDNSISSSITVRYPM